MAYVWLGERMAEEHRRHLHVLSGPERHLAREQEPVGAMVDVMSPDSVHPSPPARRGAQEAERRPLGHQVGALLIRVGTRMGGAVMRPS